MLTRLVPVLLVLLAVTARGQALVPPSAIRPLRQVTSGSSDQFFGQLHPDGKRLVFATNLNGTVELFTQAVDTGTPELLFDEHADVSQPRLSADGRRLLYLSYRDDAFGDACVLELATSSRRCLPVEGAALHAFWFADGRVGVVNRLELGGRHRLLRFAVDAREAREGEVLFEGYFSGPVASPDGRWLAYVELQEGSDGGAPALLRASRGLVLQPLTGGGPTLFQPVLPGTSAFPAFSPDGRFLFFTQFPDDSNADGVTDGNDNGILVRVPFVGARAAPAAGEESEVLTSRRANCQYPMPAADRLIATCNRRGALQLVTLPLSGQVPAEFDNAQLDAEAAASRHRWERLLLQEHRLEREHDEEEVLKLERRLAMSYLELGNYDSAEFDLGLMQRDAGTRVEQATWARVATELVQHRRDEARLSFAKLSDDFVKKERERLARLVGYEGEGPTIARLSKLVRAEVLRVLGQKAEALALYGSVDIDAESDPDVALLWGRLSEVLYREYDDRERWAKTMLRLSRHRALTERERLLHARRFVDVLTRGRGARERLAALAEARALLTPGSEVELLVDVEVALDETRADAQAEAITRLEALWRRAPSFEQHRMVAMTIVERAAHEDLELLLETFGRRWLDEVPAGHPERKYAEALFAEVQLEHAYMTLQRGDAAEAARRFLGVAQRVRSLEALSGFVEASARAGAADAAILGRLREAVGADSTLAAFGEAITLGRRLPGLDGAAFFDTLARARRLLLPLREPLARSTELHHLLGFLAHEEFHHTGLRAAALEAHGRYHLALDLAPDGYRRRASLLLELGLLQAALGNHRIALKHFEERARLPFVRPAEQAAFHLARARSLVHAGDPAAAARASREGLAFVDATPALAGYRALALERAMLCHLIAGQHDEAVRMGEALVPLLPASVAAQVKARLALAAAHLKAGRPQAAVSRLEEARAALDAPLPVHTADALEAHGPTHLTPDDLRALVAGLDAEARGRVKDLDGRQRALAERARVLGERQRLAPRDETLHELAWTSYRQAHTAATRGDWSAVERFLEEGLAHAATWRAHSGAKLDEVSVATLELCARVRLDRGQRCPLSDAALAQALREVLTAAAKVKTRQAAEWRWWIPAMLTRLESAR